MSYTYADKKRAAAPAERTPEAPPAPSALLRAPGAASMAEAEASLRPVDLPGAIRAKMEASFGADLSAVKLYESQTVADAGAQAVAQGSRVAFAPGVLDLTSQSGQALLGHELSHVVSQARGEVTGSGFLNDSTLEARADREGAMAAAGQQVYAGPVTAPLSAASAASAAGPMQARKAEDRASRAAGQALPERQRRVPAWRQQLADNISAEAAGDGFGGITALTGNPFQRMMQRWQLSRQYRQNQRLRQRVETDFG